MSKTGPCSTRVNILSVSVQWRMLCIKQTGPFPVLIDNAPKTTENTNPNQNPPDSKLTKQYLNSQAKENRAEKSEKNNSQTDQHKI